MKKTFAFFSAFLMLVILSINCAQGQKNDPQKLLELDYPKLAEIYKDKISTQKAHYIFAIDVSSSISSYEQTIKANIKDFIDALPDGDRVTFIRKASSEKTGIVDLIQNQEINKNTRESLHKVLNSDGFKFFKKGDKGDESDGYKMAETIVDVITNSKSRETGGLVFVFMFTDFEYWTVQNKFNKNNLDWKGLADKLKPFMADQSRNIYSFGLRLPFDREQSGVYESELENIFGKDKLTYISVTNTAFLQNWFIETKAKILVYRLKHLVYSDLKKLEISAPLVIKNDDIIADLEYSIPDFKLFSGYDVHVNSMSENLINLFIPCNDIYNGSDNVPICKFNKDLKPIIPEIRKLSGKINFSLTPVSEYDNELGKLNLQYQKPYNFNESISEKTIFIHLLPLWLFIIFAIIALLIIFCIISTIIVLIKKYPISGKVTIYKLSGTQRTLVKSATVIKKHSVSIGKLITQVKNSDHIPIDNVGFQILLKNVKKPPCCVFKKSGLHLFVIHGTANYHIVVNQPGKTIMTNQKEPYKRGGFIDVGSYQIIFS